MQILGIIKKQLKKIFFFFLPEQLKSAILFEVSAYIGNVFAKPLKLDVTARNFINLGSGPNILPALINIDFFTTPGIDYGSDLRRPLMIADATVDGIFCEHTIEHLTYAEAERLLRECHRIMKPGGVIRIVLPDISLFIEHFCDQDESWFRHWERLMFIDSTDAERAKRRLATPLQAISFVTQEYGHVSCWDFDTLLHYLRQSGFSEIKKLNFQEGCCPELLIDLDSEDRKFVSVYVEAIK